MTIAFFSLPSGSPALALLEVEPRKFAQRTVIPAPGQYDKVAIRGPLADEAPRLLDLRQRSLLKVDEGRPLGARFLIRRSGRERDESPVSTPSRVHDVGCSPDRPNRDRAAITQMHRPELTALEPEHHIPDRRDR